MTALLLKRAYSRDSPDTCCSSNLFSSKDEDCKTTAGCWLPADAGMTVPLCQIDFRVQPHFNLHSNNTSTQDRSRSHAVASQARY